MVDYMLNSNMTKKTLLLKDVIIPFHPTFSKMFVLNDINPEWFDISLLLEETMAHVGGYKHLNLSHMDFSDGSDCKSSTINNRKRGLIDRVVSHGGKEKRGMLRVVIYNSITQKIMYYALQKKDWLPMVKRHPTNKQGSISYGYSVETDTISKIENFRCNTFEELCLIKDERNIDEL